jgi:ABC-type Mn2+/Zn2+ transport system permease subunit
VILASALLVLPGASARPWSTRIGVVVLMSVAIGVVGVVGGLLLAIYLRHVSPAAVIVLALVVLFAFSHGVGAIRRRAARRRATSR